MTAEHYRYRLRLARHGLMRFLGQLDLMRAIERALRRCGFRLRPREGFRTGIKLSFPLSLPLGFEAEREVFQLDLGEPVPEEQLKTSLQESLPEGLEIREVRRVGPYQSMKVVAARYECEIPAESRTAVANRIREWQQASAIPLEGTRKSGTRQFDLKRDLVELELAGDRLRFTISHAEDPTVRPIEVLEWLGIADQLTEGLIVSRTDVLLADELPEQPGVPLSEGAGNQRLADRSSEREGARDHEACTRAEVPGNGHSDAD